MDFLSIILIVIIMVVIYITINFFVTITFAKIPRNPVDAKPNWGVVEDYRIPTHNNKHIEAWVVYPDIIADKLPSKRPYKDNPAVVITHGWGRNRGRMVSRARFWNKLGFTTIIISARDHGNSDKELLGMSIVKFSHDIDSAVNWWGKPVIIQGHSVGAGASIITGAKNSLVKGVIAEAPPRAIPEDLDQFYTPIFKKLTPLILPGIKLIMKLLWAPRYKHFEYSPILAAQKLTVPLLVIHGKEDQVFSYEYSKDYETVYPKTTLKLLDNTHHSNIYKHPEYANILREFVEKYQLDKI